MPCEIFITTDSVVSSVNSQLIKFEITDINTPPCTSLVSVVTSVSFEYRCKVEMSRVNQDSVPMIIID